MSHSASDNLLMCVCMFVNEFTARKTYLSHDGICMKDFCEYEFGIVQVKKLWANFNWLFKMQQVFEITFSMTDFCE